MAFCAADLTAQVTFIVDGSNTTPGPLDTSPYWNDAAPDLSNQDVQGDIRPTNLQQRDRGADQIWP